MTVPDMELITRKGNIEYYYNTESAVLHLDSTCFWTGGFSGGSILGYQEVTNESELSDLKQNFLTDLLIY